MNKQKLQTVKNTLLSGWNFIRVLRLLLGIIVIVQSIVEGEWILFILGILFSLTAVLNIGCCGVSGCAVPASGKSEIKADEIIYEEVY